MFPGGTPRSCPPVGKGSGGYPKPPSTRGGLEGPPSSPLSAGGKVAWREAKILPASRKRFWGLPQTPFYVGRFGGATLQSFVCRRQGCLARGQDPARRQESGADNPKSKIQNPK